MLSMTEINMMLKENFERQLQEVKDLPEDLARGYKNWVQGLVQAAAQEMSAENAPPPEQDAEQPAQ